MSFYEEAPEFATALARAGISDYESAMGHSGGRLVAAHEGRSVVRIEGTLFLKRFIGRQKEARRERRAMEALDAGPGPDPVSLAAWGDGPNGAFLVTAMPRGCRPLPEVLGLLGGRDRRRMVEALGERIRALHDRGLANPDLLAHHLIVGPPDRVFLIDAGRLARRSARGARERDLAALELTLPFATATRADRARFLRAYLRGREGARERIARIERVFRVLDRRSRHRRNRVVASPRETGFLARHGIGTFDELMAHDGDGAERLRRLPDRENWRVELGGRVFFVKRHRPVKGLRPTPASLEWRAIDLFRRSGIRTMRPVVMGEDVRKGSTIWVERARGEPLDDLLRRGVPDGVRRELVGEAAAVLARMRSFETHHRDMYACHLIADPERPAGERLTVIDLQRARRRPGLRKRWYVKDAAQLLHSAPRPPVTRTDLVRFLRAYFGVGRLGSGEKGFARKVRAKAASIA